MDAELFMFYKNSLSRDLCKEYSNLFKKRGDDKDELFKLCMERQSIPYLATSIYEGWGVSIDYLKEAYKRYLNGRYTLNALSGGQSYSYQLWCDYRGSMKVKSATTHLLRCTGDAEIQKNTCPYIYISNKSNINIKPQGYNTVFIYLFDESIVNIDNTNEFSNIIIYRYSDNTKVIAGDTMNVKQFDKTLRL